MHEIVFHLNNGQEVVLVEAQVRHIAEDAAKHSGHENGHFSMTQFEAALDRYLEHQNYNRSIVIDILADFVEVVDVDSSGRRFRVVPQKPPRGPRGE